MIHVSQMNFALLLEFFTSAEQDFSLGFGGLNGRSRKKQGPPIERDLFVSLEDVYYGAVKKVTHSRRVN